MNNTKIKTLFNFNLQYFYFTSPIGFVKYPLMINLTNNCEISLWMDMNNNIRKFLK